MESKAYWNYDADFLKACEAALTISKEDIKGQHVYVLEEDNDIIGFFSLVNEGKEYSLDFFFMRTQYIGKGFGGILWEGVIRVAWALGITSFLIDSDPYAKGFYENMGAVHIGDTPSTVFNNRQLPQMRYEINRSKEC
ncbi:GNAT family N-acetyltransferase [Virgibacillus doumboii]|uniref:GNAT family N-acetyltransferase n=1 Tax=Virgibacillus doumboii TaxID=2697503 RepID=UPI001FE2487B|nr:GNAT family N-acetyltransferase [Virgibacillus doumboii]